MISLIWLCGNQDRYQGTAWYVHEGVRSRAVLFCLIKYKKLFRIYGFAQQCKRFSQTSCARFRKEGGKRDAGNHSGRLIEDIPGKAQGKRNEGKRPGSLSSADAGDQGSERRFLYGGRGIDPTRGRKKLAYQIGTVFGQKEQLWTHLTPYDNFRFFGAIYDIPDGETEERIGELTERFELQDFINTPVRKIVASLLHKPAILFLDEPTIGLDPVVKENIRSLIRQMNREYHTTVFLTSHDVGDIEKLCKRIIIVNDGQIVLDDTMEHLKYHYLNKKIVEAKMHEEAALPPIEGITVLKEKSGYIKLEVDTAVIRINDALRRINADHVEDINISNIPLENIIRDIYAAAYQKQEGVRR